ncbi:hypothetical protein [Actinoplanes sp. CA-252034]|uniref:hypothetical protein n=1 Tax=Actinoplanes sp. CA-252034 TaxID=3239906 RepID=UPI003D96118D
MNLQVGGGGVGQSTPYLRHENAFESGIESMEPSAVLWCYKGGMQLHGYDERKRPPDCSWLDVESLMAGFGVDRTTAQRVVEEEQRRQYPTAGTRAVDGSSLLHQPAFWMAHLGEAIGEVYGLEAIFGSPAKEAWESGSLPHQRLDAWPVLTVPLPIGGVMYIIYRTEHRWHLGRECAWVQNPAEHTTDFWLVAPSGQGLLIASLAPALLGPGLRWQEAKSIAQVGGPGRLSIARRLLLLAPIIGDRDAGPEAVAWLAQALSLVGAVDRSSPVVREVAESLVFKNLFFRHVRWRRENDAWVCDGGDSPRNPTGRTSLCPQDLQRASESVRPFDR